MLQLLRHLVFLWCAVTTGALPSLLQRDGRTVSREVFDSLEELARIVDIAYCVGSTGIQKPFECFGRCSEFKGFELVKSWNTGPLLSDSCGYIVLSHAPYKKRLIVAFRGTYSIANTIADLSTIPAEYVPYLANSSHDDCTDGSFLSKQQPMLSRVLSEDTERADSDKCSNCTVHLGFMTSWRNTRCTIIPAVEQALSEHPDYELTLVGHSLGGAVAALAGLEFQARGWKPVVTTFGEPRLGNHELNVFINEKFNLNSANADDAVYRRVTHVDDPVPLLPLQEWGFRMHAGEIFISKKSLPPTHDDLEYCTGDEDPKCIANNGQVPEILILRSVSADVNLLGRANGEDESHVSGLWPVPSRYRLWQLFFAHRDYFWRLGLCVPWGDPWDWTRPKPDHDFVNDDNDDDNDEDTYQNIDDTVWDEL